MISADVSTAYKIKSLPDVDFDIGEMYSGMLAVPYWPEEKANIWKATFPLAPINPNRCSSSSRPLSANPWMK
jgi:hypothetical protein